MGHEEQLLVSTPAGLAHHPREAALKSGVGFECRVWEGALRSGAGLGCRVWEQDRNVSVNSGPRGFKCDLGNL